MIDLMPKPHIVGSGISSAYGVAENASADACFDKLVPALNACHCENGTYEGNGSAALTITFQRKPMFVVLYGYTSSAVNGAGTNELIYIRPAEKNGRTDSTGGCSLTWGDTSLTITLLGGGNRHNASGYQYYYFAITE